MAGKFNGWYYKHQKGSNTISFIPGVSDGGAFIQVIYNKGAVQYNFPRAKTGKKISVDKCEFSCDGIRINLPQIKGEISYSGITPIKGDIMGPFRFFPMECRHGIISMRHDLAGSINIFGEKYVFDGGIGYIEHDFGRSFPDKYLWLQANDFMDGSSIMLSVAKIPFCGIRFDGCICVIKTADREYRFASYCGAVARLNNNRIVIKQKNLCVFVYIEKLGESFPLSAPDMGKMSRIIRESNNAAVHIKLIENGTIILDNCTSHAGFENHGYCLN